MKFVDIVADTVAGATCVGHICGHQTMVGLDIKATKMTMNTIASLPFHKMSSVPFNRRVLRGVRPDRPRSDYEIEVSRHTSSMFSLPKRANGNGQIIEPQQIYSR